MKDNKIWVRARCLDYYKLISKLEYMDVLVYDAKYNGEYIYLLVSKESLERLEKYLVSYKFKVVKKMGLGKLIDFWHDNKIWIVAVVLGLVLMFGLQNMIVKINIVHENQEIRDIIKDELDNYGIKVLSFKKSYAKLNKIRGEILDKHPKTLDWMEFEVKGMVMTVRVEERKIVDIEENTKVCDVVASKNGVVSAVQVRAGEAKVNVNDYVRKGDILISGVIKHNEEVKRNVCADGEVYATTWYTVNIKVPYNYNDKYKTGKKKYNIVYKHEGKEKKILNSRYNEYDTIYIGGPVWWGHYPMAMFTLLEKIDFNGKIVKPFSTHEGSGLGSVISDVNKLCKGAIIKDGLAIRGCKASLCDDELKQWIWEVISSI